MNPPERITSAQHMTLYSMHD